MTDKSLLQVASSILEVQGKDPVMIEDLNDYVSKHVEASTERRVINLYFQLKLERGISASNRSALIEDGSDTEWAENFSNEIAPLLD